MKLLCAFVRNPTGGEVVGHTLEQGMKAATPTGAEPTPELREDVQEAMEAISTCHARQLRLEKQAEFRLDLRGAGLRGAVLMAPNLSGARLKNADLREANLWRADLSNAWFSGADLTSADLTIADLTGTVLLDANLTDLMLAGAKLTGAMLIGANLSGTRFTSRPAWDEEAIGLTQHQLDSALCDPMNSPNLAGMVNPDTKMALLLPHRDLDGKPHPKLDDDADD